MTRKYWRRDLTGLKFNLLTCVGFEELRGVGNRQKAYWRWMCDCGDAKITRGEPVVSGRTKSCGCLQKESAKRLCEDRRNLPSITAMNSLISSYRRKGRKKFSLTKAQFIELVSRACHYCGLDKSNKLTVSKTGDYVEYNGIDRVDSSIGYRLDNCVTCCKYCNIAKNSMTLEEFGLWVIRIHKNLDNWYEAK